MTKSLMMMLPGYYDVRYRSPLRGTLMLMLTGSVLYFAITCLIALRTPGEVGVMSAAATPNFRRVFPMPPDERAMDLYLSVPHAEVFYGVMILSLVTVIVFHVLRIKAIWRIQGESGDPSEMPTAAENSSTPGE